MVPPSKMPRPSGVNRGVAIELSREELWER
jgi:hypothetical protein